MATISITIADARLAEVVDYIARALNYTGTDRNGDPETKNQFARRMVVEQVQLWVIIGRKHELEEQIANAVARNTSGIS